MRDTAEQFFMSEQTGLTGGQKDHVLAHSAQAR